MMKSMEYELSEYMKELLIKGFVKTELINSWLSRKHTKYIGRWIYALNQLPHMLNFYSMVFSGECNFIDTISKDFLHIHPMRTVQLSKYIKNDSGNKSLFGYKLNDLEVDILIYSLGKLSVEELILKLREKYDDITLINTENIENVLRKLSAQYLLVYSKY